MDCVAPRTKVLALVTLSLLVSCKSDCRAQDGAGKETKPAVPPVKVVQKGTVRASTAIMGPAVILSSPIIQDILALTDKQRSQLKEASKEIRDERIASLKEAHLAAGIGEVSPEELASRMLVVRRSHEAKTAKILKPEQYKRYIQLAIQIGGPIAITWPEVQDALNLDSGQRWGIQERLADVTARQQALHREGQELQRDAFFRYRDETPARRVALALKENGPRLEAIAKEKDRLQEAATRDMFRVLTRKQRETFEKIQGDPIDLEEFLRPGGGFWRPEDAKKYVEWKRSNPAGLAPKPPSAAPR